MTEEYINGTRTRGTEVDRSTVNGPADTGAITSMEQLSLFRSLVGDRSLPGGLNAPLRQSTLLNMQRVHGNRAIQRYTSTNGQVAVQRDPWGDVPFQDESLMNARMALTGSEPDISAFGGVPYGPAALPSNEVPYGPAALPMSYPEEALPDDEWYSQDEYGEACYMDDGGPIEDAYGHMGSGGAGLDQSVPSADEPTEEAASTARKGRTAASKTATALREGSKALSATGRGVSAAEETLSLERLMGIPGRIEAAEGAVTSAKGAQESSWINRNLGTDSKVGKGLRGSNYALQFWENLTKGQGLDEALVGAATGGYINNNITRQLFDKKSFMHKPVMGGGGSGPVGRNMGWIDTAINFGNAGLNLLGVGENVTAWTQAAADATPSSFGTSLGSNAARGLWNTGKGIFTGDWDALQEQGQSIVQGKEGAPLQGYGMGVELFTGDHDKMLEESRSGKRGYLPQLGTRIGKWARGGGYDEWDAEREGGPAARERFLRMQATEPMREASAAARRRQQENKDREDKERFDKEMAAISEQIMKGPAMPATMLGGPGDALSARNMWQQEAANDEEDTPYVSMSL